MFPILELNGGTYDDGMAMGNLQGMTCDVRSQVASCDVRVRTQFFEACDVRACGAFSGLRCAIATSQVFQQ